MDWEQFSIEHLSSNILGLSLDQIRPIAEAAHFVVQSSNRLFQDRYIVAAHGLSITINSGTGNPVEFGPDFLTAYLIDVSDGSIEKVFEESDKDRGVVAVDVSPDGQTAFIMTQFDDFPSITFIGEHSITDLDCRDLIGAPVGHKEANIRWSEEDDDTIVYYNFVLKKDIFLKVDRGERRVYGLRSSSR